MLNYLHKHIATILCFSAIAFVFTGMLFVTTETANADDNIVYKRCEIRYYYCLSAEFQNGTPIYSRASVATLDCKLFVNFHFKQINFHFPTCLLYPHASRINLERCEFRLRQVWGNTY